MTDDERLIFTDFKFDHFPDGRCRAEVELTRRGGDKFVGLREGKGAETVALRCAAQASVDAIQKVVDSGAALTKLDALVDVSQRYAS